MLWHVEQWSVKQRCGAESYDQFALRYVYGGILVSSAMVILVVMSHAAMWYGEQSSCGFRWVADGLGQFLFGETFKPVSPNFSSRSEIS